MVQGELRQAYCTVRSRGQTDVATTPDVISRLECAWDYEAVDCGSDFYGDREMNSVVEEYSKDPVLEQSSTFVIPIGGMRMLDNMARIARGRVLHLVGDKGYVHADEFLETLHGFNVARDVILHELMCLRKAKILHGFTVIHNVFA